MTKEKGVVIAAATDGACSGNPGPGGWGAMMRFENGTVQELGGHEPLTTNNRMELKAALSLLEVLNKVPCHPDLSIRTDSKYLIDGLSKWIIEWKKKGWKTSSGKPVSNQDLWKELDKAMIPDIGLEYVRAHSGDPDNERVDKIAVAFSKGIAIELQSTSQILPKKLDVQNNNKVNQKTRDYAPLVIKELLSRLEAANKFCEGDFSLTAEEIAKLTNEPIDKIMHNIESWQWRDWQIAPSGNARWKLKRLNKKHTSL